jgi:peptidyl-prolyl cis-trans isomerase D
MAVVLGLIAISFAVWGIGDIFRGFGRSTVAKIGSTEITTEQFRQIYNERLQQFSRQIGRPIPPDQARALKLDEQIAAQLMMEASLDQRARQLRLNLSDAEIARQIMEDPNFRNISGRFDRARFDQIIRSAGYTEARYTSEQRRLTLRREIAESVGGDMVVPKTAADALHRFENEQRAVDFVIIDRNQAGDVAAPSAEEVAKYFEANKGRFQAPEYRTVVLLRLTPAELARPDEVSDADARRYYEDNLARFGTPERRQVQQIVFPSEADAQTAVERLNGGLDFAALASERGLSERDMDLGLVTKAALVDRAIADAAFALAEGAVSAPVQGRFGTTIVRVVKIEPDQSRKFEDVAADIKQMLALDRAKVELGARHDKIEDERAAGQRLTEIAEKFKLTARTIDAVDGAGRDPDGKPVADLPSEVDVVANAFKSQVNVENDPVQVPGGGYIWYEVTAIKPSRERALEEVRAQVEQRMRDEEIAQRVKAKATALFEKAKTGAALADLVGEDGLKVESTFGLRRGKPVGALSARALFAIFRTAQGEPGMAEGANATEWTVFRVTDIGVLAAEEAETKRIEDNLRRSMTDELTAQYIQRLQADVGATLNTEAMRRAIGGTDQN